MEYCTNPRQRLLSRKILMKRAVVVLALLGTLTSCHFIPGTQAHDIREAQEAVRYQLNDPDAGQFRNDRELSRAGVGAIRNGKIVAAGPIVCGEVNAKNRMGAYVGFKPYAYELATKKAYIMPELDGSNEAAMAVLDFPPACKD